MKQISNEPPCMGAKSTTISNHPSTPFDRSIDSLKYAGLKLSYSGKLLCAQQDLASRCMRVMYALRNNVVDPDVNILLNLFVYSVN